MERSVPDFQVQPHFSQQCSAPAAGWLLSVSKGEKTAMETVLIPRRKLENTRARMKADGRREQKALAVQCCGRDF